jgi:hypothetical protein
MATLEGDASAQVPAGARALQAAMARSGLDALLLFGLAATEFAGGHRRLRVHAPGWPLPAVALTRSGPPHVVSPDPDGAMHLPADRVHGIFWDPAGLLAALPAWLDGSSTIGLDTCSPAALELVREAMPAARLADASLVVAEAMLAKGPSEIARLRSASELAGAAAEAGLDGGLPAMVAAMEGCFPLARPRAGRGRSSVALVRDGYAGEARRGPGDPGALQAATELLRPGSAVSEVASALPPGVEIVGLGRGFEAPVMRAGRASPAELRLADSSVLTVRCGASSVTVLVAAGGTRLLSPSPAEVTLG